MKTVPKIPRGPPALIEVVCESTLRRWTVNGWSSFGLSLDVVPRKGRLLLPELKVLVLKEFLEEHPLPRPGSPAGIRDEFREAVRLAAFDSIRPRTAYSRARSPHSFPR
jgi:hypothetical protein